MHKKYTTHLKNHQKNQVCPVKNQTRKNRGRSGDPTLKGPSEKHPHHVKARRRNESVTPSSLCLEAIKTE